MRLAQHPNVVALYEAFEWTGAIWVVMERLDGGSLAHAVVLSGGFREPHVAYTSQCVLLALEFMHKHDIVHRDLKSANLMFTTQGDVKIIDFGLCRDVSRAPGSKFTAIGRRARADLFVRRLNAWLTILDVTRDGSLRASLDAD